MANLSSIICSVASSLLDSSERLMVKLIGGRNAVFVGQVLLVRLKRQFSCTETQTKALYQFLRETVSYLHIERKPCK